MACGRPIIGAQETLCIRVPKVYDWVVRQVDAPVASVPTQPLPTTPLAGPYTVTCTPVSLNPPFNPIDPTSSSAIANRDIICEEMQGGRDDAGPFVIGGAEVTLQRVKVLKKGLVRVDITGFEPNTRNIMALPPIYVEWRVSEKFFLCAPPGTELVCHITDFECDASAIFTNPVSPGVAPTLQQVDVSVNLCQEVQMEADVKIQVTAEFCEPRPDQLFPCPPRTFPTQCPTVFPGEA